MVTIREVAKIAGVSPSTVSRVINGTAKVDEEKRKRVLEAIEKTNFQPNELARALFKKTSRIIGLIVPNIENPFFSELAKVIEDETFARGYRLLLCNSNNDTEKETANIGMLSQMKADGVIIITNSSETVTDCRMPVVVVDRHVTDGSEISSIESNHYMGGRLATKCLIDKGCKDIVCIRGPQEFNSGVLRFNGYQDVCKENGVEIKYVDSEYSFESGTLAAMEMLEKFPKIDGVFAANDMVALSTYKVFRNRGIRVPEDVQMVGFDDIGVSSLVSPELTTIHQPISQMGKTAVDMICNFNDGNDVEKEIILDVELIERETTR